MYSLIVHTVTQFVQNVLPYHDVLVYVYRRLQMQIPNVAEPPGRKISHV